MSIEKLNIDKAKMEEAYWNKYDVKSMVEFIGYIDELTTYFENKAWDNVSEENRVKIRKDIIRKIICDLYKHDMEIDKEKNNSVFAYFYKFIYIRITRERRSVRLKKNINKK